MSLLSLLGIPRTTCTVLGVLLEQAVEVYPSALLLRQVFVFNLPVRLYVLICGRMDGKH